VLIPIHHQGGKPQTVQALVDRYELKEMPMSTHENETKLVCKTNLKKPRPIAQGGYSSKALLVWK
jgi:hypothetical protein